MPILKITLFVFSALILFRIDANAVPRNEDGPRDKPDEYEKIYDRTILNKSLDEYFSAINGGWSPSLQKFRSHLNQHKNYLVIHAQEPKMSFDFRSPEKFRRSMESEGVLNINANSLGIGHMFLSWRCQINENMMEGTVGMTGELNQQFKKLLDNGYGLGAFLARFQDGHLQTPELLDFEFSNKEELHTLAIEVDASVCQNAVSFVKEFLYHENEPYKTFGLSVDPDKFEGGGCGSFGATVLQKSGIFGEHEIISTFWRSLKANSSLFGYGLDVPEDTEPYNLHSSGSKKVSLAQLFTSQWDSTSGPTMKIMDPEMLLLFLKTVYRLHVGDLYNDDKAMAQEFKSSRLYQTRTIKDNNSADGKIHIGAKFDAKAAKIVEQTTAWVKELKAKGYKAHSAYVGRNQNFIGIILDRE